MKSLAEIKNWFKTGLKPTQIQFWMTWESFWHKEEIIPQSQIQDLQGDLANKADSALFDRHTTDVNAHAELFAKIGSGGGGGNDASKANLTGGNTFSGKQTIAGNLELKGNVKSGFEWYSSFGGPETGNMYFDLINPTPEYPEFDGLFFFAVAYDSFDENIQNETIKVRLSVDDVFGDYIFTKNEAFDATTGYGATWTMPALAGYSTIYLDGALLNKITPNSVKLNLPADTDYMGNFLYDNVVQVQSNGTLKAVVPVVPTIGAVLSTTGNIISTTVNFTTNDNHNTNQVNGTGSSIAYNANDGSGNDRFASYTLDGIRFNSYYNSPTYKYGVSVVPNMTQGNTNQVEVVLPKKSGHIPVKTELQNLIHKTFAVTASTLSDTQILTLITPADNSGGDYRAAHSTLIYNGTAHATWNLPVESFTSYRYTIINNTGYTITINRVGITTFWVAGASNTSVTLPANGWAEIIGSEKENRFYFNIQ